MMKTFDFMFLFLHHKTFLNGFYSERKNLFTGKQFFPFRVDHLLEGEKICFPWMCSTSHKWLTKESRRILKDCVESQFDFNCSFSSYFINNLLISNRVKSYFYLSNNISSLVWTIPCRSHNNILLSTKCQNQNVMDGRVHIPHTDWRTTCKQHTHPQHTHTHTHTHAHKDSLRKYNKE